MTQSMETIQAVTAEPNFPKIENPTNNERIQLDGYLKGIINRFEMIMEIRKDNPTWLPEFRLI